MTGSSVSPIRGAQGEFVTLIPSDGDAYLRVQRVLDGPGGGHLDLHVDDPLAAADEVVSLGASEVARDGGFAIMQSPGGLLFYPVSHHGEHVRPSPTGAGGERPHLTLGAALVERFAWWTVMADPSGMPYCLARRNPDNVIE